MKSTKQKADVKSPANVKKNDAPKKIVLGAGAHLAYIADTLFDDDLKR